MKLQGQVALVTGAGRGVGRVTALRLARLGADVVINDINLNSAKEMGEELTADSVMDEVKALGRRSIGIQADVSNKKDVDMMFERILAEFGRIDILVNNAGMVCGDRKLNITSRVSEEILRKNIDVNLFGTIFCSQAACIPMIKQRYGRIVNITTGAALRQRVPGEDFHGGGYSEAKAGVTNFTWYLAAEVGRYGINVNCVSCGIIPTKRMVILTPPEIFDKWAEETCLGRNGELEDVAKAVEFFVTGLSDFVTAQTLSVCGGLLRFR